jgi:hypothetical protein
LLLEELTEIYSLDLSIVATLGTPDVSRMMA